MKRFRRKGRHPSLRLGSIALGGGLTILIIASLSLFAPMRTLFTALEPKRYLADHSAQYISQFPKFFSFLKEISPKLVPENFPSILSLRHDLMSFERLEPLEKLYPRRPDPTETLPALADLPLPQNLLTFGSIQGTQETGIWKVSAAQDSGPRDAIHFSAIPLLPGQSILLGPAEDSDEALNSAWDLRNLNLNFINFGATPDRLDAPGKLLFEMIGTNNIAPGEKTLAAGVASAGSAVVEVSHVPAPTAVALKDLLFEGAGQLSADRVSPKARRVKLTWSKDSSGVLLLMGSSKNANLPDERQRKGFLYLKVNELQWDRPLLPKSHAALRNLQSTGQDSSLQTFHEVWHSASPVTVSPLASSPFSPPVATLPEDARSQSNAINQVSKRSLDRAQQTPSELIGNLAESKKINLKADILLTPTSLTGEAQETEASSRSHFQLTLHGDLAGRIQKETIEKLASLVAGGAFVQLNFMWNTDEIKTYSSASVFDMFSHFRWSEMRSNTVLRTTQDLQFLNNREIFERIDTAIESVLKLLGQPPESKPEILLQVHRQPTESKRSIAQLSKEVPHSFAPGYAQFLAALPPNTIPNKIGQESFKPVTEESLLDWVTSEHSRLQNIEEIYEKIPSTKVNTGNRGSEKSNGLKVLAQSRSKDGTLIVFDSGWTFIPSGYHTQERLEQVATGQSSTEPIFGVALDKVTEAKALVFDTMTQTKAARIQFLLPALVNKTESAVKGYKIEMRSEFPITSCSSSEPGAKFERLFGQFDGTMQVVYESSSVLSGQTEMSCIVDLSQKNPIPKKKHDKQEKIEATNHDKREKEPVVTFSVKISLDGKKVSLEDIGLGPYFEPATTISSSSSTTQFDLLKDLKQLISLTPVFETNKDANERLTERTGKVALWFYPSTELNPTHASRETWQKEVSSFLDERAKLAEKLRNEKL